MQLRTIRLSVGLVSGLVLLLGGMSWFAWSRRAPTLPPVAPSPGPIVDVAPRDFRPSHPSACGTDDADGRRWSRIESWSGTTGPFKSPVFNLTSGVWRIRYSAADTGSSSPRPAHGEFIVQVFSENGDYICQATKHDTPAPGVISVTTGKGAFYVLIVTNFGWTAAVEEAAQ